MSTGPLFPASTPTITTWWSGDRIVARVGQARHRDPWSWMWDGEHADGSSTRDQRQGSAEWVVERAEAHVAGTYTDVRRT